MQSWPEARYDRIGEKSGHHVGSENGALGVLEATGCARLNIVFMEQGIDYGFVNNTPIRPSASEVRGPKCMLCSELLCTQ